MLLVIWLACVSFCQAGSPLADAAESGDAKAVAALLESAGTDLESAQSGGATALLWAAYRDDVEMAKLLLDAGANANRKNHYGVAPLALACENGNAELVQQLLAAGADSNTESPGGESVLLTAARTGKPAPVKALIAAGAEVDGKDDRKQTPLMWAAAEGHAEVVGLLLEAGADPEAKLDSGFTPWFFAARNGRLDVVRVLLKAGANANEAMDVGRPGARAPRKGSAALILAVENAHFELAAALVEAGADPNDQRSGYTALHALTWVRKPDLGDNPEGDPAPIGSGDVGSLDFVGALHAHGADLNARLENGSIRRGKLTLEGATPFFMAARTADLPLLRLLHELGADPGVPNEQGATPFVTAAGLGTHAPGEEAGTESEVLETLAFLFELGADVNSVDENGETAMHGAAYKSLPKVVQLLADRGADIEIWNCKNKSGWTPLLIAQGFRPGNFKPAADTIAAIESVMRAEGVEPPPPPVRTAGKYED